MAERKGKLEWMDEAKKGQGSGPGSGSGTGTESGSSLGSGPVVGLRLRDRRTHTQMHAHTHLVFDRLRMLLVHHGPFLPCGHVRRFCSTNDNIDARKEGVYAAKLVRSLTFENQSRIAVAI